MSSVPLSTVPMKLCRVAAQHIEDLRAHEGMPNWTQAQLGAMVYPLYRPDVDGVAYYEIPVVTGPAGAEPAGFIIVSTGNHDFPLAHWNNEGQSPCEDLLRKAMKSGQKAVKFFKLDTLAYAAENEDGELAATSNAQLMRINGLDPAWLDDEFPLTESTWKPFPDVADDAEAGEIDGVLEVSGPESIESLEYTGWNSWQELKADYASVYELLIESLRREASEDWEIDNSAEEYGEGLISGETYRLACLYPAVDYKLVGAGADFVKVDLVKREELPPALDITVLDTPPEEEVLLDVLLDYPKQGMNETVRFAIVAPKQYWGLRTIKLNPRVVGAWNRWQEWSAGTHDDQRWYNQIPPNTAPNTKSCASGCGPTAWAMLFGWGDLMASRGTARWRDRTGLYYTDGGRGGRTAALAVAPASRDAGISNITWEIHNLTGAFCVWPTSDQCATLPGKMDRAAGYLRGRTAARLHVECNVLGLCRNGIRNRARDVIKVNGDPVIIGAGFLEHYPLAYYYRVRWRRIQYKIGRLTLRTEREYAHQFHVNLGWGSDRSWISGNTWFAGWITPR